MNDRCRASCASESPLSRLRCSVTCASRTDQLLICCLWSCAAPFFCYLLVTLQAVLCHSYCAAGRMFSHIFTLPETCLCPDVLATSGTLPSSARAVKYMLKADVQLRHKLGSTYYCADAVLGVCHVCYIRATETSVARLRRMIERVHGPMGMHRRGLLRACHSWRAHFSLFL